MRLADNSKTTDVRCLAIDLDAGSRRLVMSEILGAGWKLEEVARFRTPARISAEYGPCVPESVSRRFDELLSAREMKGEAYA